MYKNKNYQLVYDEFKKALETDDEGKEYLDWINELFLYPRELGKANSSFIDMFEIIEHLWFEEDWKAFEIPYIDSVIIGIAVDFKEFIADYIAFYSVSEQLMKQRDEFIFLYFLFEEAWIDFVIVVNDFKVYLMFWDDFIINQVMWNFVNWVSYIKYSDYQKKYLDFEFEWEKKDEKKIFIKENVDFFIDLSKYDFEKVSIELKKWKVKFIEWEESLKPLEKWKEMEQEEWFDYWDIRKVKHWNKYVWIKREIKKKYK